MVRRSVRNRPDAARLSRLFLWKKDSEPERFIEQFQPPRKIARGTGRSVPLARKSSRSIQAVPFGGGGKKPGYLKLTGMLVWNCDPLIAALKPATLPTLYGIA